MTEGPSSNKDVRLCTPFHAFQPLATSQTRSSDQTQFHVENSEFLRALTLHVGTTFRECAVASRKSEVAVFSSLSEPFKNNGYDNNDGDLICRPNDVVYNPEGCTYEMVGKLGQGTFGQVMRCSTVDGRSVALKVIKNKPAYFQQALVELRILQTLGHYDRRIVKMVDHFVFRKHLCIVFELLGGNLYELLRQNGYRGLEIPIVRSITQQLLRALVCLKREDVIHCDLKPENILMTHPRSSRIKLIDFGSAAFAGQVCYSYIQSRFYRAPDVILGLTPFTPAIDVWSLGCILAELLLGLPFFPGANEFDQLTRIVELLGSVPVGVLDKGKNTRKFYKRIQIEDRSSPGPQSGNNLVYRDATGDWQQLPLHTPAHFSLALKSGRGYKLHSRSEFEAATGKTVSNGKRSNGKSLRELIVDEISTPEKESILHLLHLCFEYDPSRRITPAQALTHPFFSGDPLCTWRMQSEEDLMVSMLSDSRSFLHTSSAEGITRVKLGLPSRAVESRRSEAQPGVPLPDDSMPVSYRPFVGQHLRSHAQSPPEFSGAALFPDLFSRNRRHSQPNLNAIVTQSVSKSVCLEPRKRANSDQVQDGLGKAGGLPTAPRLVARRE